jgi:Flp pilus assembly protein TadG
MKRVSTYRTPFGGDSSGSVFVSMIFIIISLLIMAGLAIDGGRTFHAQHALQKATDAGVLAAVTYTNLKGISTVKAEAQAAGKTLQQFLVDRAAEVVTANLDKAGFPPVTRDGVQYPQVQLAAGSDFTPNGRNLFTLNVSSAYPVNYLLMHRVSNLYAHGAPSGDHILLNAVAGAIRKLANVCLMLDFSASMQCPSSTASSDPGCQCLTENRTGACPSPHKMDTLIEGVKTFVKRFDFNNEHIVIVPFNIAAQAYTLPDLLNLAVGQKSGYLDSDIDAALNRLKQTYQPAADTNIIDALMRGHALVADPSSGIGPNQEVAYVLFSDGAPSAGRFYFANPKGGLAAWNPGGTDTLYDYSFHSVAWLDSSGARVGPSVMYQTNRVPFGWTQANPPPSILGQIAACGPQSAPTIAASGDQTRAAAVNSVFGGCLNNLGTKVPSAAPSDPYTAVGAPTSGSPRPDDPGFNQFEKLYYIYSLAWADYLRSMQGTFYVIGLGPACSTAAGAGGVRDFFQDMDNTHCRKDFFFRRLANDFKGAVVVPTSLTSPAAAADPEPNFTGYQSYADWQHKSSPRTGEYYPTPTDEQLNRIFLQIAQNIATGLVK